MRKLILFVLCICILTSLCACGKKELTAEAYTIANDAPVRATVVAVKPDKLNSATLEEAFKPDNLTDAKAAAKDDDVVSLEVTSYGQTSTVRYYKTVYVAGEKFTFDEADKAYKNDKDVTFDEWVSDAGNCEKYFKALDAGDVSVELDGKKDKSLMTAKTMYKSQNGYWTKDGASVWNKYKNATIKYLVDNGFAKASTLKKNESGIFVDESGVSTGASWSSMNEYVAAIKAAFDKAIGD